MNDRLSAMEPPVKDMVGLLREVANGFEMGQIFYTGLELGVFTALKEASGVEELSRVIGTKPDITVRFLDALVSMKVLSKAGEKYYTPKELVPFLVEGEPYFARYLKYSMDKRHEWMDLGKTLKEGHSNGYKPDIYHVDRDAAEHMAREAMMGRLQTTIRRISGLPGFKDARRLIDLGGGHGLFGIGLAQENPGLEVCIFDRPGVTDVAHENIMKYGLQERVRAVSGDYHTDDIGSGYDMALDICSFEGGHEKAGSFYEKVARSLNDDGLFIKTTFTLDDDKDGPWLTCMFDLGEKVYGHGHVHMSNKELFEAYEKAGLGGESVIDLSEELNVPMRLIIARKMV